eukprot:TRINITY_DN22816_c0_g1_i2.p1 TRINITY_DN22816_c0_g1~~TRINITY_DN22816_c0_g1_i2.p1  ORF type:complete len:123 (-),score=6.48 TRINITY_DN22816_c0_g1_i2:114-482(-)
MGCNTITNQGISTIADGLGKLHLLTNLRLAFVDILGINDEGVIYLIDRLTTVPYLSEFKLSLFECGAVRDPSASRIADFMREKTTLTKVCIELRFTGITRAGRVVLRNAKASRTYMECELVL